MALVCACRVCFYNSYTRGPCSMGAIKITNGELKFFFSVHSSLIRKRKKYEFFFSH